MGIKHCISVLAYKKQRWSLTKTLEEFIGRLGKFTGSTGSLENQGDAT